jgi:UDP-GlcNAc:undecaprenyl-phosphate GlcNAc-1-phosphate transferase
VGIFLSCAIVYVAAAPASRYTAIALASAGIALLGFIDDRIRMRPLTKFCGQSIAAAAVISTGVVFHITASAPLNVAITFLWITGITNAFNLIDNMDGLCAGVTAIICAFRFWPALHSGDTAGAVCLALIGGAFLGFLLFNYKPAKIFMGDAGSMFAGFALASLTIAAPVPQTRVFVSAILYPVLTFFYPIFDTVLVSILRRMSGTKISIGGRDHSSHRLASLGLEEQRVVWLLWILAAIGAAGGLLTYSLPISIVAIAFFLMLATTIFGVFLASLPGYELPHTTFAHSSAWLRGRIPLLRAGLTLAVDALISGASLFIVFALKWEHNLLQLPMSQLLSALQVVMGCQVVSCLAFRTFHIGWRWIGVQDVLTIGRCVLVSSGAAFLIGWAVSLKGCSWGTMCLYALLVFVAMTGARTLLWLLWRVLACPQGGRRAAILWADQSAESIILMLRRNHELNAIPALILDTDPTCGGIRIHGIPVCCTGANPLSILQRASIHVLILPELQRGVTPEERDVLDACEVLGIPVMRFECRLSPVSPAGGKHHKKPAVPARHTPPATGFA